MSCGPAWASSTRFTPCRSVPAWIPFRKFNDKDANLYMTTTPTDYPHGNNTLAAILFFVGVILVYLTMGWAGEVFEIRDAQTWPTTAGNITGAKPLTGCGKGQATLFSPSVSYFYTVAGKSYEGSRMAIGTSQCGSEGEIRKALEPFPVGSAVTVHFNPQSPDASTLSVSEVSDGTWASVYVLSLLAIAVLSAAAWLWRRGRQAQRSH